MGIQNIPKYNFLIIIFLLCVNCDIEQGLIAHYPLNNTLKDLLENHNDIINQGTTLVRNRHGRENSAYHFVEDMDVLILPAEILNNKKDFTISIWAKADKLDKRNACLFSLANTDSEFLNLFTVSQSEIWISSFKTGWESQTYLFDYSLFNGNWQHILVTKNTESNFIEFYSDGKLFFRHNNRYVEDGQPLKVQGFVIGNDQNSDINSGFYPQYQFQGAVSDLRIYDRYFEESDVQDLFQHEIDRQDREECVRNIVNLKPDTITVKFEFLYSASQDKYFHDYQIKFNSFDYKQDCYDTQVWIGSKKLDYFSIIDNSIQLNFQYKDAEFNGCRQTTNKQQQCQFKVLIYYEGILLHQKLFTSILNTPNPQNLQEQVNLKIRYDEDKEIKNLNHAIQTQINFCEDIECKVYLRQSEFVRNMDMFVEFRILTHGYRKYYPVHNFLKLDNYPVKLLNQIDIDNWNKQGAIVYHIQPPFANDIVTLKIGVSLQEEITYSQTVQAQGIIFRQGQSGYKQKYDKKDNIGNYIDISIKDFFSSGNDGTQYVQKTDTRYTTLLYLLIVFLVVFFIVAQTGMIAFYKIRKQDQERQQNYLDIEPTSSNRIGSNNGNNDSIIPKDKQDPKGKSQQQFSIDTSSYPSNRNSLAPPTSVQSNPRNSHIRRGEKRKSTKRKSIYLQHHERIKSSFQQYSQKFDKIMRGREDSGVRPQNASTFSRQKQQSSASEDSQDQKME